MKAKAGIQKELRGEKWKLSAGGWNDLYLDLPTIVIAAGDRNPLQALALSFLGQSHPLAGPLLRELRRAELLDSEKISEDTESGQPICTGTIS